jgi:hypothetical protein
VYHDYGGKVRVYSTTEHIAKSIWLGRYSGKNFMAMLSYTAYFDLSGEPTGFPVISVAGAVAPVTSGYGLNVIGMQR